MTISPLALHAALLAYKVDYRSFATHERDLGVGKKKLVPEVGTTRVTISLHIKGIYS